MAENILIIGDETDPHVLSVCKFLDEHNARVIVLNPAEGKSANIAYSFSPFKILISDADKTISCEEIDAVWWRLKPNARCNPTNMSEAATENFIAREWQMALEPLSYFLKDCYWLNKRSADLLLRNKPYQLYQAGLHGFALPNTVIGNNYNFIAEASEQFEEIMYKPLGYFNSTDGKLLFSNKMSRGELSESRENIVIAPCIFQNYVDKDHELRITVVDKSIFAVKIHSQENELSKSDWRRNQFDLKYEVVELEKCFEEKLLKFHKSIDLVYGAYDFIVDQNGDHVFLEVNPVGQWLWLERKLGIQISQQIADTLLQGK
jgi:glutathione synthase/RimK-type ligase-like ATP-grasp enzyme